MNKSDKVKMLLKLEWQLITRTSRTRLLAVASVFSQAYMLIFILKVHRGGFESFLSFLPVVTVFGGMTALAYAQFGFGWQGRSFAFLLSKRFEAKDVLLTRFLLLILLCAGGYLIPLCVSFFVGPDLILLMIGGLMYSMGFCVLLNCCFFKFFKKKVDLTTKGIMANWQGQSAAAYVASFAFLIPPAAIILLKIKYTFSLNEMAAILFSIGVCVLIYTLVFVKAIYKNNTNDKYWLIKTFE